jgi:hypothetical protein
MAEEVSRDIAAFVRSGPFMATSRWSISAPFPGSRPLISSEFRASAVLVISETAALRFDVLCYGMIPSLVGRK